jgi:hypothetical protein
MDAEKSLDPLYPRIFDQRTTKRKFEHDSIFGGLGLAEVKPEGASVTYDSMVEGPEKVYTQATYANGFIITKEMKDFAQAGIVMQNQASELRKSLDEKKEELLADVLNNAFDSSITGADGKELCATDHPIQDGLTIRNELTTAADLAESALEQAIIDIHDEMKDYRGKKRSRIDARFLIVPTELVFEAQRILKSNQRVATADNDTNAIKDLGLLSEPIMYHKRLTDADAWFLKLDVPDGLKVYQSEAPRFQADNDFDTFNMKFVGYERYAYGWSDYRAIFGTPGAA